MQASSWAGRAAGRWVLTVVCAGVVGVFGVLAAAPARATPSPATPSPATPSPAAASPGDLSRATVATDVQAAAQAATARGYRTGVAVLDLRTGAYTGAGEDTAGFAAESVVKALIATELLLTDQMSGSVESMAYQMITQSDDGDADALYGLAGGDDVVNLVAAHYGITDLGTPPSQPGWWGNTELTAEGLVQFYAAIAKDPAVGPWLMNAMAHATRYGSDGTDQFFGLPSATTGAAVKQGWGDDGDDSPDAVFNSTGFVDQDRYAVAILTDGPPSTYGAPIAATLTAQAQALMPGGVLDPTDADPQVSGVTATTQGSTVHVTGSASDPDEPAAGVPVQIRDGAVTVASTVTGADSRFDVSFQAPDGAHAFTVVAVNRGAGIADTSLPLQLLSIDGDPSGRVLSVTGGAGTIRVRGVESDPNLPAGRAPRLTLTVDGQRIDEWAGEQAATPGGVPQAAYDVVVDVPAGRHRVTVSYEATGLGDGAPMGSWTVAVTPSAKVQHRRAQERGGLAGGGTLLAAATVLGFRRRRRSRKSPLPRWSATARKVLPWHSTRARTGPRRGRLRS